MWMVQPDMLCRKHLLGEHGELHKHKHNFEKQHSISKRIAPVVQIEPSKMQQRHDELVVEMKRRRYNHQSPYEQPDISYLPEEERNAMVDPFISIQDLKNRCSECAKRIESLY